MANRQEAILRAIRAHKAQHNGVSPSIRDIGEAVLLSSTSWVSYHLTQLQAEHLLSWEAGKSRTIQLPGSVWLPYDPAVDGMDGHYQDYVQRWDALFENHNAHWHETSDRKVWRRFCSVAEYNMHKARLLFYQERLSCPWADWELAESQIKICQDILLCGDQCQS